MTKQITVHHAHGARAPRDWEVEVVKPAKGNVIRNEAVETGHVLEFEVAPSTRELAYHWWDAASTKPDDLTPVVLTLSADPEQRFDTEDAEFPPDEVEAAPDDEGDQGDEGDEDDEGDETRAAGTEATQGGGTSDHRTPEGDLDLYALAEKVDRGLGKVWGLLDDLVYRVEQNESRLDAHIADHPSAPTTTPVPVTEPDPITAPQPTSLEAAALLAAAITTVVRDGFTSAADTFAARLGVDPSSGGASPADRTWQQLTLAAGAATSAIARYAAIPGTSRSSSPLAAVAFAGEVRAAGDDYAETVDLAARAAERTSDPGESATYAELLRALRADPVGPAIAQLRGFTVGSTDRQGVAS